MFLFSSSDPKKLAKSFYFCKKKNAINENDATRQVYRRNQSVYNNRLIAVNVQSAKMRHGYFFPTEER